MKKIDKEIKAIKTLIKYVEKGFGKDKCRGYAPNCANCQGQTLLGHLESYRDLMLWEKRESKK